MTIKYLYLFDSNVDGYITTSFSCSNDFPGRQSGLMANGDIDESVIKTFLIYNFEIENLSDWEYFVSDITTRYSLYNPNFESQSLEFWKIIQIVPDADRGTLTLTAEKCDKFDLSQYRRAKRILNIIRS